MQLQNLFPISVDLPINDVFGEPTGVVLKVVGQDSKAFRDVSKKIAATMLGNEEKADIEKMEKQGAEMAAACIAGWSGLEEGDQPIPFSREKAVENLPS